MAVANFDFSPLLSLDIITMFSDLCFCCLFVRRKSLCVCPEISRPFCFCAEFARSLSELSLGIVQAH